MAPPSRWIGVIGPGEAAEDELAVAEEVGAAIAERGAVLVCGGLGGVMEAACRGARSRGGFTVGLLPGPDREAANGWVQFPIATGLGEARNVLVVRAADALVAVGGGWGTLSEIALALKTDRPVIGLGTWEPVRRGQAAAGIHAADDPRQAVDDALQRVEDARARRLHGGHTGSR